MSYIVPLRTREVGVRIAVGAQKAHILRLILGQIARPVLVGIGVGLVLGAGASFILRGMLYGLNPVDPLALPSRDALRLDPALALRYE